MNIEQSIIASLSDKIEPFQAEGGSADLLLVFAPREWLEDEGFMSRVGEACPKGTSIVGCSSAGEIAGEQALGESAVLTFLHLEKTALHTRSFDASEEKDSRAGGMRIAEELKALDEDLSYVMVFADGLTVNGSLLVEGLSESLNGCCDFSGGLAGDGADFVKTLVVADGKVLENSIVAVGFYGKNFHSHSASVAGWKPFGAFRKVTKSVHNVVHELDGQPALGVYSAYLGEEAKQLPFSGLLYPLEVHLEGWKDSVIRTLLAVDEEARTLTFAGDVPEGSTARLMNADYRYLVEGAREAANKAGEKVKDAQGALCISCVGRKLAMGHYTDLEVEAVKEELPAGAVLCGFHSYGEIGPSGNGLGFDLHNQTMTVVFFEESIA